MFATAHQIDAVVVVVVSDRDPLNHGRGGVYLCC